MVKIKAIIPAAGYATRLYPLTLEKPKHLLEVKGKPIIEHVMNKITGLEIDEVYIVTNLKYYIVFKNWLENYKSKIPIKLLNDRTTSNENRLGQIGDIQFVIEKERIDDDLLIVAGDNLFNFSLKPAFEFFQKNDFIVNALYDAKSLKVAKEQGVAIIDKDNKFIGFQEKPEKPESTLISLGIYFLKKGQISLFKKYIEEGNNPDKMGYFMTWVIERMPVYGYVYYEKWFDIGWVESLEQARNEFTG